MLQIAVTGKPNVGKSSFFNSATASQVEMANYLKWKWQTIHLQP